MSERLQDPQHKELVVSSPEQAMKRLEEIRSSLDKAAEKAESLNQDAISAQAEKLAQSAETLATQSEKPTQSVSSTINLSAEKQANYRAALSAVHKQLSLPEKSFSNVIHSPIVDKVAEITAQTVGRPSSLLGAFLFTFIGSSVVYIISRKNGYAIDSYYYLYILMILGAAAGLLVDLTRYALRKFMEFVGK